MISANADVDATAQIGEQTQVWHQAQIRENAIVGRACIVGRGAYIDAGVLVGDNCKIQNSALIYAPARLGDGVFIGPAAILTNDPLPRAVNPDGSLKSSVDWHPSGVEVGDGAAIGAAAVVLGGVKIGAWSLVAAGAVVIYDVPERALMVGVPARRVGWVGRGGERLVSDESSLVDSSTGERFVERDGRLIVE